MKDRTLFTKTILSFIAILFLTVIVISLIFNSSYINYSQKEIGKVSIGKLKVIQTANNLMQDSIRRDALRLSLDTYLLNISLSKINPNKSDRWNEIVNFTDVIASLHRLVNDNSAISSIYIYLEDINKIVSSNTGVDDVNQFYDTSWIKTYDFNKRNELKPFSVKSRIPLNNEYLNKSDMRLSLNVGNENVISYVFPLSLFTPPLNGAVIINLRESAVNKLIRSEIPEDEGSIFIINHDGDVITHLDNSLVGTNIAEENYIKQLLNYDSKEGFFISQLNEKKQIITYYKPDKNGWIYIGVFNHSTLMHKVAQLQTYTTLIILVLSIISLLIFYWVSRKLYSPVYALIQNIKKTKSIDLLDSKNEVTVLSSAFETLIKQEKTLNSILESNRKSLHSSYLTNLAYGIIDQQRKIDIVFPYSHFTSAILCIDDYTNFSKSFSSEQHFYIKTAIINVCEKVLGDIFICFGADMEKDRILLVININNYESDITELSLLQRFRMIKDEVSKILSSTISIGVGGIYSGLENIKYAYSDAMEASRYRLIYGYGSITESRFCNAESSTKYFYPFETEEVIINCITNGSKSGLENAVKDLIRNTRNNKSITPDNVVLTFNQLLGKIIVHLLSQSISVSSVFGEKYNIFKMLSKKETLEEIEELLISFFSTIIDYCNSEIDRDNSDWDKILKFIHKNYKIDMDIDSISEKTGISYTRLRKLFVNKLGLNIISYINKLRIEEAKKLLVNSETNVIDIALGLGYSNDQSFNRYFKKFEGITPSEFRHKHKNSSQAIKNPG